MNFSDMQEEICQILGFPSTTNNRVDFRMQMIRDAINRAQDEIGAIGSPRLFAMIREGQITIPATPTPAPQDGSAAIIRLNDWTMRVLELRSLDDQFAYKLRQFRSRTADRGHWRASTLMNNTPYNWRFDMAPRTDRALLAGASGVSTGATVAEGGISVVIGSGAAAFTVSKSITNAARAAHVATITASSHGFSVGDTVIIAMAEIGDAYLWNGTFTITSVATNTFTYALTDDGATESAAFTGYATVPGTTPSVVGKMLCLNGESGDYKIVGVTAARTLLIDRPIVSRLSSTTVTGLGAGYTNVRWDISPKNRQRARIIPAPTVAQTLNIRYMALPRKLLSLSDVSEINEEYHRAIVCGAMRYVGAQKQNGEIFQAFKDEWNLAIAELQKADDDTHDCDDSPDVETLATNRPYGVLPGTYTRGDDGYGGYGRW